MEKRKRGVYELRLYIFGRGGKSESAVRTVEHICTVYLENKCSVEIIDLSETPERGYDDGILATPTLIRRSPAPECRIIGDLSKTDEVMSSLEIERER